MQGFAKDVFERLTAANVEFVIVGGVSVVLQESPITTRDLDLCYRRTHREHREACCAPSHL